MSKRLSERETAALKVILANTEHVCTGPGLADGMRRLLGDDTSPAGAHRTAASLCRKQLAWRAGTPKLQWYKITQTGRDVLGGKASAWRPYGA